MANQFLQLRSNVKYVKREDQLSKVNELIFLTVSKEYAANNDGEIVRSNKIEKFSMDIWSDDINDLITMLESYRDAENEELK